MVATLLRVVSVVAFRELSAGSWPLARVPKISAQVAMNSATVSATTVWRMCRLRARRAASRGCTVAAVMAESLRPPVKPRLRAV